MNQNTTSDFLETMSKDNLIFYREEAINNFNSAFFNACWATSLLGLGIIIDSIERHIATPGSKNNEERYLSKFFIAGGIYNVARSVAKVGLGISNMHKARELEKMTEVEHEA